MVFPIGKLLGRETSSEAKDQSAIFCRLFVVQVKAISPTGFVAKHQALVSIHTFCYTTLEGRYAKRVSKSTLNYRNAYRCFHCIVSSAKPAAQMYM